MKCWFLSHRPFSFFFFWTMGSRWDISTLVLYIHGHTPLNCPNLSWSPSTYPEDPKFLRIPRYLGSIPSWLPSKFLLQGLGWASFFFFPYFLRPRTYPFIGLDPFLLVVWVLFFVFFSTQAQVETRILSPILIVLRDGAWFTTAKLGWFQTRWCTELKSYNTYMLTYKKYICIEQQENNKGMKW